MFLLIQEGIFRFHVSFWGVYPPDFYVFLQGSLKVTITK